MRHCKFLDLIKYLIIHSRQREVFKPQLVVMVMLPMHQVATSCMHLAAVTNVTCERCHFKIEGKMRYFLAILIEQSATEF
jgi:hypothetical protein